MNRLATYTAALACWGTAFAPISSFAQHADWPDAPAADVPSGATTGSPNIAERPVWKRITLGTYKGVNALRAALDNARVRIGESADEVMGRPAFRFNQAVTDVDLVVVTVSELGFHGSAPLADIYWRAGELGLELCPAEVAPLLRLQYVDQPLGEFLNIAMRPVATYGGDPIVLSLANAGTGPLLIGGEGAPGRRDERAGTVRVRASATDRPAGPAVSGEPLTMKVRILRRFACGLAVALAGALGMSPAQAQIHPTSPLHPVAGIFPDVRQPRPLSPLEERALGPLDHFKECATCPEMVVVPGGNFLMGAPDNEEASDPDERPRHKVMIARPFAAGRFAVTFDEWDACVAAGGCRNHRPADRGWGRGRRPVINVRWEDARAYVTWLSHKTGKPYRLLSEAEREYVTRAGTTTPFWWGSAISPRQANYDGKFAYPAGASEKGEFRSRTMPVDSFAPNPWGLYQVHGNVFEWVEDCWRANYEGARGDGSARTDPDCAEHVARGGSWNFAPWHLRAASRGRLATAAFASGGVVGIGLRVARTLNRR